MTGTTHRCDSKETWDFFIQGCEKLRGKGEVRLFQIINPKTRSLSQNDMKEQQVAILAEQLHDGDEKKARNQAKYYCGVPILYKEDKEFAAFCDVALKFLDEDQRIEAMSVVPVTSRMNVGQMRRYIDKVFDMYAESVDWGDLIKLTEPAKRLYGK